MLPSKPIVNWSSPGLTRWVSVCELRVILCRNNSIADEARMKDFALTSPTMAIHLFVAKSMDRLAWCEQRRLRMFNFQTCSSYLWYMLTWHAFNNKCIHLHHSHRPVYIWNIKVLWRERERRKGEENEREKAEERKETDRERERWRDREMERENAQFRPIPPNSILEASISTFPFPLGRKITTVQVADTRRPVPRVIKDSNSITAVYGQVRRDLRLGRRSAYQKGLWKLFATVPVILIRF